jgi:hypothetical protein
MPDNLLVTKPGHNDWTKTPRDAHSAANDLNSSKRILKTIFEVWPTVKTDQ